MLIKPSPSRGGFPPPGVGLLECFGSAEDQIIYITSLPTKSTTTLPHHHPSPYRGDRDPQNLPTCTMITASFSSCTGMRLVHDKEGIRLVPFDPSGQAESNPFVSFGMDTNLSFVDPSLSSIRASPTRARRRQDRRRKNPPSRSVSPTNQTAGVLFRLGPETVESICVGAFDHPALTVSVAGQTQHLPKATRDYGFECAARERTKHPEATVLPFSNYATSTEPDNDEEEYNRRDRSNSSKPRRIAHAPNPKNCISCGATKTPYWREAWSSSVLLCNACGLRYSKFRRRCLDCSYVPRKEDKGSKSCTKCGGPWS